MSYEMGLLLVGIPVIIWLTLRAVHRFRLLKTRIADVQEELQRHPESAYATFAELFHSPSSSNTPQERPRGKRTD